MKACALIVDDEPDIRELLEITLGRMGLDTVSAAHLAGAKAALTRQTFQLCLTDMKLPDGDGIALVTHIQQQFPALPVAVITAFGSAELAVNALKAGAFDFVSKPVDLEILRRLVQSALNLSRNAKSPAATTPSETLLGNSEGIRQLREQIAKLARSQAPVHIQGESGSGKELVARAIHEQSGRCKGPFVAVNCGAIPRELMESEFFGHKKGSFTGAIADKAGLFQTAQGGTLFLDEVADLPLDMQVKLLRAIQEKSVRPVGAEKEISIDARILSATHKDLQQAVAKGDFRQDLFFRINVIQVRVPPLRERPEDIALLCQHFLIRLNRQLPQSVALDDSALQALQHYDFPGNVRELENLLERASTLCELQRITLADLQLPEFTETAPPTTTLSTAVATTTEPATPVKTRKASADEPFLPQTVTPAFENLDQYLETIERNLLEQALTETRWNKTATAQRLGISFRQLRHKLKKLGME
jgi:two-component system response regulator PilR (NtrC family)